MTSWTAWHGLHSITCTFTEPVPDCPSIKAYPDDTAVLRAADWRRNAEAGRESEAGLLTSVNAMSCASVPILAWRKLLVFHVGLH
jgi:hypothetical protein